LRVTFYYRADLYQFQARLKRAAEASMRPSDAEDGLVLEGGRRRRMREWACLTVFGCPRHC